MKMILLFACALVAAACGDKTPAQASATATTPALFTAESVSVTVPLSVPAQVYVEQDTWLYARTTGILDSLLVDIGSAVHTGDLVATLESADQSLALQQAELAFEAAQRTADRAHSLVKGRDITQAEIDQAETALRQAEVARAQARRAMTLTRVTAPFGGVVAARSNVRVGRLVVPGDSILRITALGPLRATIHVPEAAAAGLKVGSVGVITGLGGSARATVIRAAPSVDAASGTRELVLEVGAGGALRPGASVTVRVGGEKRRVLAIPTAALADSGYAVVWQDGRSSLRAVTLGAALPDGRVEITNGLAAGERLMRQRP